MAQVLQGSTQRASAANQTSQPLREDQFRSDVLPAVSLEDRNSLQRTLARRGGSEAPPNPALRRAVESNFGLPQQSQQTFVSPRLLAHESSVEVALDLPNALPDWMEKPLENGSRIVEEKVQEGIEALDDLRQEAQRRAQPIINGAQELYENVRTSQPVQLIEAVGGAVLHGAGQVRDGVVWASQNPGEAAAATWQYIQEVPASLGQLVGDPKGTVGDILQYGAPEIRDNVIRAVSAGKPGLPPDIAARIRDSGEVFFDSQHGLAVRDSQSGLVIDFGPGGIKGYRVPVGNGYSEAYPGRVETDSYGRVAVVPSNGGLGNNFRITSDGWQVRGSSGQFGDAKEGGVLAALTDPATGNRTYGVVQFTDGAKENRIMWLPNGQFRVDNSLTQGYSQSYNQREYHPVVLENRTFAKHLETGALISTDKNHNGLVGLQNDDGSYSFYQGQFTRKAVPGEGIQAAVVPADKDLLVNGKPAVFRLDDGRYLVKGPNEQELVVPGGRAAALKDPATGERGAGVVVELGDGSRVFYGSNGLQVQSSGGRSYSRAVAQGEVVTAQVSGGSTVVAIRPHLTSGKGPVVGDALVTDQGTMLLRSDGSYSAPLPGKPTVLDGRAVVENWVTTDERTKAHVRTVSDGEGVRVADPTGKHWTSPAQGTVMTMTVGNGTKVGVTYAGAPGVSVFPNADGSYSYSLKNPDTGSWLRPTRGEIRQDERTGEYVIEFDSKMRINAREQFFNPAEAEKGWQSLNRTPETDSIRRETTLQEKVQTAASDAATATRYTFTPEGFKDLVFGEGGITQNTGAAWRAAQDAFVSTVTSNGVMPEGIQPGDPRYTTYSTVYSISKVTTEGGLAVAAVGAAVPTNGGSLVALGAHHYTSSLNEQQWEKVRNGGDPLSVLADPRAHGEALAIAGINTVSAASAIPINKMPLADQLIANALINGSSSAATAAVSGNSLRPTQVFADMTVGAVLDVVGARLDSPPQAVPSGVAPPKIDSNTSLSNPDRIGQTYVRSGPSGTLGVGYEGRDATLLVEVGPNAEGSTVPKVVTLATVDPGTREVKNVFTIRSRNLDTEVPSDVLIAAENIARQGFINTPDVQRQAFDRLLADNNLVVTAELGVNGKYGTPTVASVPTVDPASLSGQTNRAAPIATDQAPPTSSTTSSVSEARRVDVETLPPEQPRTGLRVPDASAGTSIDLSLTQALAERGAISDSGVRVQRYASSSDIRLDPALVDVMTSSGTVIYSPNDGPRVVIGKIIEPSGVSVNPQGIASNQLLASLSREQLEAVGRKMEPAIHPINGLFMDESDDHLLDRMKKQLRNQGVTGNLDDYIASLAGNTVNNSPSVASAPANGPTRQEPVKVSSDASFATYIPVYQNHTHLLREAVGRWGSNVRLDLPPGYQTARGDSSFELFDKRKIERILNSLEPSDDTRQNPRNQGGRDQTQEPKRPQDPQQPQGSHASGLPERGGDISLLRQLPARNARREYGDTASYVPNSDGRTGILTTSRESFQQRHALSQQLQRAGLNPADYGISILAWQQEEGGTVRMVVNHIGGQQLDRAVRQYGLTREQLNDLEKQALRIMKRIEGAGLGAHIDPHPGNFMVDESLTLRLIDPTLPGMNEMLDQRVATHGGGAAGYAEDQLYAWFERLKTTADEQNGRSYGRRPANQGGASADVGSGPPQTSDQFEDYKFDMVRKYGAGRSEEAHQAIAEQLAQWANDGIQLPPEAGEYIRLTGGGLFGGPRRWTPKQY